MHKWNVYNLLVHERITIAKVIILSEYTYIVTILDVVGEDQLQKIQLLDNFIAYNINASILKNTWIPDNIMYINSNIGCFNRVKIYEFFKALKVS